MSNGRSLKDYAWLPQPELSNSILFENIFIVDELNYNEPEMVKEYSILLNSLTNEQVHVYEGIMVAMLSKDIYTNNEFNVL